MRVLRMISRLSRRDHWENRIRNERIREDLNVESIDEAAGKSRLGWFGHVQRMNESRLPKLILNAETNDPSSRGRPRRRYLGSVKCDLNERGYAWNRKIHDLTIDSVF